MAPVPIYLHSSVLIFSCVGRGWLQHGGGRGPIRGRQASRPPPDPAAPEDELAAITTAATRQLRFLAPLTLPRVIKRVNSIREAMVMANNVYKTLGANAQTLTLLATVCLEDPVTQEKAKTLLDKALTQRPDYIKAVVKKAELLSREQKYEDGIALLRNALANQSDCVLHRILGDFLVAVNEYQEAMDQYSIALSLDPNDQKSLEGMQKMEKEESPTDATQEEDVDDMEGSGEEGDLEGSDSEAAQWADQEQWFGMQ